MDAGRERLVSIVDDDESVRDAIHSVLKSVGLRARSFASAEEFLRSGRQRETACLVADIKLPGMSGLELQARLAENDCRIPIIFITAHGDKGIRRQAMRAGAVEFLEKPFDTEVFLQRVHAAVDTRGNRK